MAPPMIKESIAWAITPVRLRRERHWNASGGYSRPPRMKHSGMTCGSCRPINGWTHRLSHDAD